MNEHQLDVQQQEHQIIATGFEPVTTPLKDVALSIETYTTTLNLKTVIFRYITSWLYLPRFR